MHIHLIPIDGIGKTYHSVATPVGRSHRVIHICKQRRRVAVGMIYMKSRFKIILHAMSDVSLHPSFKVGIILGVHQTFSQIRLIDTTVMGYIEYKSGVGGLNHNLPFGRRRNKRDHAHTACKDYFLDMFHGQCGYDNDYILRFSTNLQK